MLVMDPLRWEKVRLTLLQLSAFYKSFSVCLYFPFLLLTDVLSVRVVFVASFHSQNNIFIVNLSFYSR